MVVIPLVAACNVASAQQPSATTRTIDLGNMVEYQEDIYDPVKFARSPNVTPSLEIGLGVANFAVATLSGDIVAVNGQPQKVCTPAHREPLVHVRIPRPDRQSLM